MSPNTVLYTLIFGAVGVMVFAVFYGDEQGWGVGPTIGLSFAAFAVATIAYVLYERARKRRRREAAPLAASSLGLVPADDGGTSLPGLPAFGLTSRGLGRQADNVMSGSVGGDVWVFDYTYYTESQTYNSSTGTTSTSRRDHYFSCALAALPGNAPTIQVEREGLLSRVARGLGFEDVEVGDAAFDRTFKVKAQDAAAALELLDPLVRQWLITAPDDVEYEVSGRYLLAYTKQRELDELRPLLDAAVGLRDQLAERLPDDSGGAP